MFAGWTARWATECRRVLKPGGFLLAFGSPRTAHRLAVGSRGGRVRGARPAALAVQDQASPSGETPEARRSGCLKPAWPIVLARAPARAKDSRRRRQALRNRPPRRRRVPRIPTRTDRPAVGRPTSPSTTAAPVDRQLRGALPEPSWTGRRRCRGRAGSSTAPSPSGAGRDAGCDAATRQPEGANVRRTGRHASHSRQRVAGRRAVTLARPARLPARRDRPRPVRGRRQHRHRSARGGPPLHRHRERQYAPDRARRLTHAGHAVSPRRSGRRERRGMAPR